MNKIKIFITVFTLLILILFTFKVNFKQDLVWNIKNLFPQKIVFQLKKLYIFYIHNLKNEIILEKKDEIIISSTKSRDFDFISYNNNFFKKNGPKVFLEVYENKLLTITGTGLISFTDIEIFDQKKKLKVIRSNITSFVNLEQIVKNPGFILNMKIFKDKIFVSYINELKKDCFNTIFLKAQIDFKKINFQKIYNPNECVNKENVYGEFYIAEAGGAMDIINEDQMFVSTGTFRFRDFAQNKENIFGKILLVDFKKNTQNIVSMGHRNIQGMHYDNEKNILLFSDHGPQGGDEINLDLNPLNNNISNYGWPIASYGEHYGGMIEKNKKKYEKAPLYKSHKKYGFVEPLKHFVPSIAPSDILYVPQEFDPSFKNNLYLSSLGFKNDKGRRSIHTFEFNSNYQLDNHEILPLNDRVRDIEYYPKSNSILLFLEKTASIGFLKKRN